MLQTQPDVSKKRNKKRSTRPSSSGLLIFVATFIVSLVVFAGAAILWVKIADIPVPIINPDTQPSSVTTTAPTNAPARFDREDRFSVAVYVTDDSGALQTVSLAMFNPDEDSVDVIGLPSQTVLSRTDNGDTLYKRFSVGGVDSAQMGLNLFFAKTIDYYAVLSYTDVESLFTQLGQSLIFDLPVDVDQQAADGSFSIHLDAGERALTPKQTANLFRYDSWQGGRRERADMHATLVAAYIDQFVSPSRSISSDYQTLMATADCNLVGQRFAIAEPVLVYLASRNDAGLCDVIPVDGMFEGAGNTLRFDLDDATAAMIANTLR